MVRRLGEKKVWGSALCFLMAAVFLGSPSISAQEKGYPNREIQVVLPVAPGGSTDIGTRIIAEELMAELKVPIIISNVPGGMGLIGASKVLKEKPDGYTLFSSGASTMTFSIIQSPNPPYDPFKDFLPICSYGSAPLILGVHKSSPFKTLDELIKAAKSNPGKLTLGLSSLGRELSLFFAVLKRDAGVNLRLIPYKGTGDLVAALLGKHLDMLMLSHIGFLPYVKSGEARALAITVNAPNSGIPTFAELGYPKVNVRTQLGFYIAAKTPKEIYGKLVPVFEKAVKTPKVAAKLDSSGVVVDYRSPAEFAKDIKEEWDTVSSLAEEIGIKTK